eukprot:3750019-Pleurochrysis_carterae.AAC.3
MRRARIRTDCCTQSCACPVPRMPRKPALAHLELCARQRLAGTRKCVDEPSANRRDAVHAC